MQQKDPMHPDDMRNMIIFAIASLCIWLVFDTYILGPRMDALQEARKEFATEQAQDLTIAKDIVKEVRPREDVIAEAKRLTIGNALIKGSIDLKGGRIDDMSLLNHFKTLKQKVNVQLLSPAGTDHPRYYDFGWLGDEGIKTPGKNTVWRVADKTEALTPETPLTLYWDNGQGLRFERVYTLDDKYMISLTRRVVNKGKMDVKLYPFSLIAQKGLPEDIHEKAAVHEGPIGYIKEDLVQYTYPKMAKKPVAPTTSQAGWVGFSDRYWFSGLIPDQSETSQFRFVFSGAPKDTENGHYQVDVRGAAQTLAPGSVIETKMNLFVGAKEVEVLEAYEKQYEIKHLDLAVDFGMFYILTKPLFHLLIFLNKMTHNFGVAIIILTFMVRIAVFPLANTSYKSFAKLKQISPYMQEIQTKYKQDRQKMQEELVKLYEKEKVNPMGGCFPILLQLPIFFALFKVLNVVVEMRHEPFFGWIHDLSAKDPTTVFNLFGLLSYDVPEFLMIGAWPCMMLIFMVIQRTMNPPPQDKTQAMMIKYMPFIMTFILSKFASGLVIYWTFSNALSVLQQYVIMRSMGVEVHLFKRSKSEEDLEHAVEEGPTVHPELEVIEHQVEDALGVRDIKPPKPKKKKKK